MSIAPLQIVSRLVEVAGSASAYFHRLLNDIIDTLNGQAGQGGSGSFTPDASGDVVITHGFSVSGHPVSLGQCSAVATGSTAFHVQIQAVTATTMTVRLFNMSGVAIAAGSWPIAWKVAG